MKKFGGFHCSACGQVIKPDINGMTDHKCPKSNLRKSWKDRLSSKLGL